MDVDSEFARKKQKYHIIREKESIMLQMFAKTKVSCYKVLKKQNKSIMLQYVMVYGIKRRHGD